MSAPCRHLEVQIRSLSKASWDCNFAVPECFIRLSASSPMQNSIGWSSCHQQSSNPWARVTSIAATPARIAPRTAAPYALFHQVDEPVRLLVAEGSGPWMHLGIQVEPPTSTKPCTSARCLCLAGTLQEVHRNIEWGFLKALGPPPPYSPAKAGGGVPLGFVMVALCWTRFQHRLLCLLLHAIILARDRRPFSIMMI